MNLFSISAKTSVMWSRTPLVFRLFTMIKKNDQLKYKTLIVTLINPSRTLIVTQRVEDREAGLLPDIPSRFTRQLSSIPRQPPISTSLLVSK